MKNVHEFRDFDEDSVVKNRNQPGFSGLDSPVGLDDSSDEGIISSPSTRGSLAAREWEEATISMRTDPEQCLFETNTLDLKEVKFGGKIGVSNW